MAALRLQTSFRWALAGTVAAGLAVIAPFLFFGQASGHDLPFHVASWMDVARQWREGVVFPRWAAWANYGYGEPRFIFYPPLSWLFGAGLGSLLPWRTVPATYVFLSLVLAGTSMHRLASAWLQPEGAIAAATMYAVNPYHLVLAYYRSDFAELLASALFPLAVHHALRLAGLRNGKSNENAGASCRSAVLLAIAYAAMWLSNAPAAVVASYALAFLLMTCAILQRSFKPLFAGAAALALGLMLACVYVVPAAYEQRWINIEQALSAGFRPNENFLFTWILSPEHNLVNLQISSVALLVIVLTGVGAVASHRGARSAGTIWIAMLALASASTLLMFRASSLLWRYAPMLRFVQFPWRWLLALSVSFAFLLGKSIAASRHRHAVTLVYAAFLVATGLVVARASWWTSQDIPEIFASVASGQGYEGAYEYSTRGADQTDLPLVAPLVALRGSASGSLFVTAWQPDRKEFVADTSGPARAVPRLLNYPAWQVRVNGRRTETESDSDTGQMIVPLPAGQSRVEIRFSRTADRTAGAALSGLAVLLLAGMTGLGWRLDRTRPN